MTDTPIVLFRLACFILPTYFLFSSFYNNDKKAYIYIFGLIIACVIGGSLVSMVLFNTGEKSNMNALCGMFTISGLSSNKMSISTMILSFTLFYMVYSSMKFGALWDNSYVLGGLAMVLVADLWLNLQSQCISISNHIITILAYGSLGYIWGSVVDSMRIQNSLFFDHPSNNERCKKESGKKFRCAPFRKRRRVTFGVQAP